MAKERLGVPNGRNNPSLVSSISPFPRMVTRQTIKLFSSKATRKLFLPELQRKQANKKQKKPITRTWNSLFSLRGQLFNTHVTKIFLHLPGQWFCREVVVSQLMEAQAAQNLTRPFLSHPDGLGPRLSFPLQKVTLKMMTVCCSRA